MAEINRKAVSQRLKESGKRSVGTIHAERETTPPSRMNVTPPLTQGRLEGNGGNAKSAKDLFVNNSLLEKYGKTANTPAPVKYTDTLEKDKYSEYLDEYREKYGLKKTADVKETAGVGEQLKLKDLAEPIKYTDVVTQDKNLTGILNINKFKNDFTDAYKKKQAEQQAITEYNIKESDKRKYAYVSRMTEEERKKYDSEETYYNNMGTPEAIRFTMRKYGLNPAEFDWDDLVEWAINNGYTIDNEGNEEYFNAPLNLSDLKKNEFEMLRTFQSQKASSEYAKQHPTLASVGTVVTAPVRGMTSAINVVGDVADVITGKGINPYKESKIGTYTTNSMRETVDKEYAQKWFGGKSGKLGNYGSLLYNGLMSMGDMLTTSAVAGGFGSATSLNPVKAQNIANWTTSALLASDSANNTIIDAKERGLGDVQALALGLATGATEIFTEKASLDAILGNPSGVIKRVLKGFVAEGSEEMAAETLNAITDIIIAGDESKFIQSIKNYMNQDYSYTDAINKTITDNFYNVLSAGVVGGFTGAVLGGVSGKPNDANNTSVDVKNNFKIGESPNNTNYENLTRVTDTAENHNDVKDKSPTLTIPQNDLIVNNTENNAIENELNFARENASGIEENENDSKKMKLAKKVMRALNERYGINFKIYSGEALNGFYHNGTLYINEKSEKPILSVIGHEFLHGFKDIDAEGYALLKSVTESDLRLADYERYKKNLLSDWKEAGIDISALSEPELKNAILEEAMSDMMGEIINDPETIRKIALEDKKLAERIMAYLKDFIEQIRTLFDENDAEIQSIFHNYEQVKAVYQEVVAQSNGRIDGDTVFEDGAKFSVNKSFGKQVDDVLENKMDTGYKAYLGTVSNLLAKCGFDADLPLLMSQGHIRDIVHPKSSDNTRWHGIDKDIVKQIPTLIKEPVMIYDSISDDSENTVCVVTNKKDSDGLPIIIAIKANSTDNVKFLDVEIHKANNSNYVASMYGKNNFSNHFKSIIDNDALLYANKNKTQELLSDNELQLLTRLSNFGFDKIIHQSRNIVNSNNMQNGKINASDVKLSVRKGSRAEKAQRAMQNYEDSGNVADLPTRQWAKEYYKAAINTEKMLENQIATKEWEKRYAKTPEQIKRLDEVLAELRRKQEENVANVKISGNLLDMVEGSVERNYGLADIINDLKDVDKGLKIKSGNYRFNDFYRNFERVFGKHFDKIKPLLDRFDDAKGNESKYRIGKLTEQYDYIVKQLGIKKGSKESKAVQWIAEGERNPDAKNKDDIEALKKMGITDIKNLDPSIRVPYTEAMLRAEFGDMAENILKAEQWYRKQYDEMINAINATQRRIYPNRPEKLLPKRKDYMRHFREVKTGLGGLLDLIKADVQIAPGLVSVSEHTSPKEKWASFKQERKGKATSEGAIEGFNEYIGQASYAIYINPYIEQFRSLARDLAELKSAGAVTGTDENGKSIKRQTDNSDLNGFIEYLNDFANDLAGKTGGLDRALIKSMGAAGRTVIKALQWFNNRTKANAVLGNVASMSKQVMNIPNGMAYLKNPANILTGIWKTFEGVAFYGAGWIEEHTEGTKVGKKIVEPISNKYKGTKMGKRGLTIEDAYKKSSFLTSRYSDKAFSKFEKKSLNKGAAFMLGFFDELGTRAVWNALYYEAVKGGETDPIRYADVNTRKAVAGRGIGEIPLAYKSQLAKLALPFQIEPTNSWNVMRDMISGNTPKGKLPDYGDRAFKTLVFFSVTCAMNAALEALTGSKGSFDPLGDLLEGLNQGWEEEKEEDEGKFAFWKPNTYTLTGAKRAAQNVAGDFIGSRSFGWVVGELLDTIDEDWATNYFNDSLYQSQGVNIPAIQSATKAFKKAHDKDWLGAAAEGVFSFATPFGGKQIDKTIRGIGDVARGGNYQSNFYKELSTGERGDLYYPIEKTAGNYIKAGVFGPSSLKANNEYWENKKLEGYEMAEKAKTEEKAAEEFFKAYKKENPDSEVVRLYNEIKRKDIFPFEPVESTGSYTHKKVKTEYTLTDEDRAKYQKLQNEKMQEKYNEVFKSTEYKYADAQMKRILLEDARSAAKSEVKEQIKKDHRNGVIK